MFQLHLLLLLLRRGRALGVGVVAGICVQRQADNSARAPWLFCCPPAPVLVPCQAGPGLDAKATDTHHVTVPAGH